MGKRLEICFSLKSTELADVDTDEWSIRYCAVYHSFDMADVRTSWIIVKGDELMKQHVESATSNQGPLGKSDWESIDRAFEASLKMHLIFCEWATEDWRWYITP